MSSGGYTGPTEALGLAGCLLLVLPYLFGIGFIIEDFGYGGAPGWQFALALIVWSVFALGLALGISALLKRLRRQ